MSAWAGPGASSTSNACRSWACRRSLLRTSSCLGPHPPLEPHSRARLNTGGDLCRSTILASTQCSIQFAFVQQTPLGHFLCSALPSSVTKPSKGLLERGNTLRRRGGGGHAARGDPHLPRRNPGGPLQDGIRASKGEHLPS